MSHFSLLIWSVFGLISSEAKAFNYSTSDISLGQASHINPDSFSPIRYQPASLVLIPKYQVGGGIGVRLPDFTWGFGIGAIDSNQGPLTLGVFYDRSTKQNNDPQNLPGWKLPDEEISMTETSTTLGGATAISFAQRKLSLGTSLMYLTNNTPSQNQQNYEWNVSAGACLAEQLLMGISFQNLLPQDLDNKESIIEGSVRWGPLNPMLLNSIRYSGGPFRSYGGFEIDISSNTAFEIQHIGLGGDFRVDLISIRGGATWNNVDSSQWLYGLGFGVDAENSTVEYALQIQPTANQIYQSHIIGLKLRL
jgi:hypothetical protein